tara:strand:+ start:2323 stop:3717 length:1395 start_codon:yes stop_codon:yes gene_type:complete
MKKCLIRQPAGIGDILFCQKIVYKLLNDGYEVWWPVDDCAKWIRDYISGPNFCSLDSNFPLKEFYSSKEYKKVNEDIFLPLQSADQYYPGLCMMDSKYKFIGLGFSDWSKYLKFNRNTEKEDELFKLINPPSNFTLVNKFFGSLPNQQVCKHIDIDKLDNVVELRPIPGFTIFDWCKVFEKAAQIHTVDTSVLFILETLDTTDKLFCYSRFENITFDNVSHLFNKPWHYYNNPKFLNFKEVECKILGQSQKGQDSYIDYIFNKIGTTNKYFIEFGAVDGVRSSNTYFLRTQQKWNGLLLEGDPSMPSDPQINLYNEQLTKENICDIFKKYKVQNHFDFISIDIDGNDYWLLSSILEKYTPRVIMIEACVRFEPNVKKVQKYHADYFWRGDRWYGASPLALKELGEKFNYTVVYIHLDDIILIHNDSLNVKNIDPQWVDIYPKSNPDLYISHGDYGIVEEEWLNL